MRLGSDLTDKEHWSLINFVLGVERGGRLELDSRPNIERKLMSPHSKQVFYEILRELEVTNLGDWQWLNVLPETVDTIMHAAKKRL